MGCDDKNVAPRVFSVQTVRGEPYQVGGRKLTPVARIVSLGKARGTIGTDWIGGWAGGLVWTTPVAMLEETGEGEREIAIRDTTAATLQCLCIAALSITLFFAIIRWWMRWPSKANPT
jgi:hypothetical protein